jgi:hypothetical protein
VQRDDAARQRPKAEWCRVHINGWASQVRAEARGMDRNGMVRRPLISKVSRGRKLGTTISAREARVPGGVTRH